MKKHIMISLILLLLAGAMTAGILWAVEAGEYAAYESEYADIAGQAIVLEKLEGEYPESVLKRMKMGLTLITVGTLLLLLL